MRPAVDQAPSPCVAALLRLGGTLTLSFVLAGCASTAAGMLLDKGLEMAGIKPPPVPAAPPLHTERTVPLRIHAGDRLNTDASSRSLSVVVRLYRLEEANAFLSAPLSAFRDAASERAAFGGELIDVREVVLAPGQKHEVVEALPLDVAQLGVVALFRAPAEGRWRFAFNARAAEKTGITIGVHGCAMSVASGEPLNVAPELRRLAGVRCH